jgi:hypothetical protein
MADRIYDLFGVSWEGEVPRDETVVGTCFWKDAQLRRPVTPGDAFYP